MWLTLKLIYQSFLFALGALRENLLRTILSLLGITVGIFAIIGVLTMVDAIEKGIRQSLAFMGDKVIYVDVFPWNFTNRDYPWWKYFQRPNPTYNEFKFLERNLTEASAVAVFAVRTGNTVKFKNNSLTGVNILGVSQQYNQASKVDIEQGRYFTPQENERGRNVVILGYTVAKELFGNIDPIGQQISLRGNKFNVIGVMKRQGSTLLNTPSTDNVCMIPYTAMTKMFSTGRRRGVRPQIMLKGYEHDAGLVMLENEARGLLRAYRGLKPREEDNFALNRPEAFAALLDSIIAVMTSAGWFISIFSMLVGGFGIANIMFVSVKERTNLIGIQKSLGAKNFFILFQFLYEAILLCIIGGIAGLVLVSLLSLFSTESFEISLSIGRVILGLLLASVIGILSGIVPAIVAARLDPVVAIRSK
ncbi:MAG: ABC transporter permease [Cytophagales bacterium]|nr:ABC transporter permease [Bernardetiaceae bacterium]MDW8204134.1 ABC transporter permease [Cytophagales bacterium]